MQVDFSRTDCELDHHSSAKFVRRSSRLRSLSSLVGEGSTTLITLSLRSTGLRMRYTAVDMRKQFFAFRHFNKRV